MRTDDLFADTPDVDYSRLRELQRREKSQMRRRRMRERYEAQSTDLMSRHDMREFRRLIGRD